MNTTRFLISAASMLAATSLSAQDACIGPGLAMGVTAYQCSSCGQKQEGRRYTWTFGAEPVVTGVAEWSLLKPGDVVQAVNDKPITTVEGARDFTYPPMAVRSEATTLGGFRLSRVTSRGLRGDVQVRVRRNGESIVVTTPSRCEEQVNWMVRPGVAGDTIVWEGAGGGGRGGFGGGRGGTDSSRFANAELANRMLDQLETLRRSFERTGRFGIAVSCTPTCGLLKKDGFDYWKYDAPPTVAEVRRQSPAERAGLVVGDVVLAIDGIPLTSDDGAQRFARSMTDSTTIQLTLRRNGQEMRVELNASGPRGAGGGGAGRGARGRGGPPPN